MTARQRLLKRIGKMERHIARTERMQRTRRELVRRLRDESAPGWRELVEFHLDTRIDAEPARERAYTSRRSRKPRVCACYGAQCKNCKYARARRRRN
jgi:hypothetical protein